MTQARSVTATFTLQQFILTVTKAGTGSGMVTSSPAGISCGSTCSAAFDAGTSVTLMASRASGSRFTGWSGEGCSGTGTCTVSMTWVRTAAVVFPVAGPPPATVERDFNGDGTADILWRHTSGALGLWLLNGTTISGGGMVSPVSNDWTIAGVGDFNGDGKADILWRHTLGVVCLCSLPATNVLPASPVGH